MLEVAAERESETGDLVHADMGQGLPFRPGTFDGVISISALQWLCYSETSEQDPRLRLNRFFSTLYAVMKRDAKAVLQFYPENPEQALMIAQAASKVGFAGGIVVDFPNSSKAKKFYLCLSFERSYQIPTALGQDAAEGVDVVARTTK
jgi:18S rRNA (guanine1575-N7)-methyltransferase